MKAQSVRNTDISHVPLLVKDEPSYSAFTNWTHKLFGWTKFENSFHSFESMGDNNY